MNGSNTDAENRPEQSPWARLFRQLLEWRVQQHLVRGMAYGLGSSMISFAVFLVTSR
ncbi:hypothetical protein HZZ00_37680 (plasmid) [Streptomyces sp. NEAU-sy36]|uniref:hypothetical protein n=1 Tax=unclassified Streptomyces TaxID=2593676 RepID=UPI0015D61F8A|nr:MULTISPECIES: hypothetical protein [unclassified Streptomyces]QLJ06763.1 hypothetical protein HZZ00_37680 [Streptomyces sp. NEAU-sy36]